MMDNILDSVWVHCETVLNRLVMVFDYLVSPLEIFGPGTVIFFLAATVVFFTRLGARFYVTRRYVKLKKEFEHWQKIREEALKHPDPEKGKRLAKNIDQAELNRAYYDYFFEGMLKNMVTNVLPILVAAAFITKIYTPENLMSRFGQSWVFVFSSGDSQVNVSSLFFFVISLLICFIIYGVLKMMLKKKVGKTPEPAENNI